MPMRGKVVDCEVMVLGSGPAGFYCALGCARWGKKTILVEKDRLGGTGFRWGCLPVKMMLDRLRAANAAHTDIPKSTPAVISESARRIRQIEDRIRRRLSASGVEVLQGEGRFIDSHTFRLGGRSITASRIIVATGTEPAAWPGIPLDGEAVVSHKEVLGFAEVPARLLILGADVEGVEFACLFSRLGSRVTLVEKEERILPGTDSDLAAPVVEELRGRGVVLKTGSPVLGWTASGYGESSAAGKAGSRRSGSGVRVKLEDGSNLQGDRILVTGLRRPSFPEGLDRAGVNHDGQKIPVDPELHTSCGHIYAVGDINGITGMAHAAIQQALAVSSSVAGGVRDAAKPGGPPYPRAIYTIPEIAGAGYQEGELETEAIPYRRLTCQIADTWRGFSKGIDRGFVKILTGEGRRILGIWICGAGASEQASLFGALLGKDLTVDDVLASRILHPTLGEAVLEALLQAQQE
jgi:dihydrolipoamide dehydrogenase